MWKAKIAPKNMRAPTYVSLFSVYIVIFFLEREIRDLDA